MPLTSKRLAVLAAIIASTACLDTTPQAERGRVIVLAPESTRIALESVLRSYAMLEAQPIQVARYGNSSDQARAATRGEGHLIITAHPAYGDYIAERTAVLAKAPLVRDRLLLVGPSGSDPSQAAADLSALLSANLQTIAVPSTESESVGMYAREAMLRYGIWSRAQPLLLQVAGSLEALEAVGQNAADAAFVFASDVATSGQPVIVAVDPAFHQPIVYEVLLLDDRLAQARAFYDYLVGPDGSGTFVGSGFLPLQ